MQIRTDDVTRCVSGGAKHKIKNSSGKIGSMQLKLSMYIYHPEIHQMVYNFSVAMATVSVPVPFVLNSNLAVFDLTL